PRARCIADDRQRHWLVSEPALPGGRDDGSLLLEPEPAPFSRGCALTGFVHRSRSRRGSQRDSSVRDGHSITTRKPTSLGMSSAAPRDRWQAVAARSLVTYDPPRTITLTLPPPGSTPVGSTNGRSSTSG